MKNYEKPMIFVNEQLAEGIYAASGAVTSGISYQISLSEPGNQWYQVSKYNLTVANNTDQTSSDWAITINIESGNVTGVQIYDGNFGTAALNGSQITVVPGSGGSIEAGGSMTTVLAVSYSGEASDVVLK